MNVADIAPAMRVTWRRWYRSGDSKSDWAAELVPATVIEVRRMIVVECYERGEKVVRHAKAKDLTERA
jgi:hypothetical protein